MFPRMHVSLYVSDISSTVAYYEQFFNQKADKVKSDYAKFILDKPSLKYNNKDANNDHLIVHNSTIMATRPGAKFFVPKVYAYEVLSSSEWKFTESFKPNYFEQLNELE